MEKCEGVEGIDMDRIKVKWRAYVTLWWNLWFHEGGHFRTMKADCMCGLRTDTSRDRNDLLVWKFFLHCPLLYFSNNFEDNFCVAASEQLRQRFVSLPQSGHAVMLTSETSCVINFFKTKSSAKNLWRLRSFSFGESSYHFGSSFIFSITAEN
jgi:hypothetical protein